jgi:hypothetical protein
MTNFRHSTDGCRNVLPPHRLRQGRHSKWKSKVIACPRLSPMKRGLGDTAHAPCRTEHLPGRPIAETAASLCR